MNLHGLSLEEALLKTKKNLEWCLKHGVDVLDLNHGKGHHSSRNFSVLKKEIRKMLREDPSIKTCGYKIIYGESDFPIALTFDEGHTLVVARGKENEYIGGRKQQEKNRAVFSREARKKRKLQKAINKQKQRRKK
ncbi:MAG: Smr/MutS family protein [Syntrophomonadaceae bacterium]|nr:Smr/MutS family protein [Syntrophomonadaceae bacterium]